MDFVLVRAVARESRARGRGAARGECRETRERWDGGARSGEKLSVEGRFLGSVREVREQRGEEGGKGK
jgi:hypothetical protein